MATFDQWREEFFYEWLKLPKNKQKDMFNCVGGSAGMERLCKFMYDNIIAPYNGVVSPSKLKINLYDSIELKK